ncbi:MULTISPECIES: pyridoxamine 5'-phosphate oxidase family protein [Roseomonadaceae]|uniref:Pyridoxamine 5'-phosphate oxidase family protein n=1 Tax=Falsiroseomonas oleicola TaxID=2801474 RepID=A0ABS6H927_9PROT|nr:pyridoxamine 5'-phosphate oxidase family protein [Roseomonas oleicola]MBU8545212.1 pyridoxamine 5'-phosphate oxidase family protein [Roseomonas oleicola]
MSSGPELAEVLAEAFRLLARGVADRRHPFHRPTLATIGLDGMPQARTVVLRRFDPLRRQLRLYTDSRAAKAAELAAFPWAALHGYDPDGQLQLRLRGRASLHQDDAEADAAWASSPAGSRALYAISPAPGTACAAPPPAPQDSEGGRPHFCLMVLELTRLEWLHLATGGHRRARFDWPGDGAHTATWLVP